MAFFSAGSKTTLSCAYPLTELHKTQFPGLLQAIPPESSVGHEKTPLLADWHGFGGFLAVFLAGSKTTLPFAYPWTESHQTWFLGLLQAIPPESSVGNGKTPLLADWHGFGGFLSVFRLSCAYPLTELHQTRFLGLLQAIPPESSVVNGKTPLLADWHVLAFFWRFFCWLQDDAAFRFPLDRIAPNSVSWAFAGHSTRIWC